MEINQITPSSNPFTKVLDDIIDPPKKLFYRGNLPNERLKTVAIVGARKPTSYGKEIAFSLGKKLAEHGIVVVSGMALGIDAVAHQGALDAGGATIAVLGNGVASFYPRTNANLGHKIIEQGGAVLSEYEPTMPALAHQFLERNRIVSGLSDAVIVVEAAIRSGTLSTANHALNQGREVFAVPGNISSPLSEGCNNLIKMGAHPLTSVDDVLDLLIPNRDAKTGKKRAPKSKDPIENAIIQALASGVRDGDDIIKQIGITVAQYNQAISMLEINDIIKPLGANNWLLK